MLDHFLKNVHSQFGEDGVLEAILRVLPSSDKWCVEFGAWDGRYLSNACHLIDSNGFSAVLIEADPKKFKQLTANFSKNRKVLPICKFVGWKNHTLDEILADTPIPLDFDFLSIDVDGNDYHIWEAVRRYVPKIVCIEFNPTIATGIDFVQPKDASSIQGASLSALVGLGKSKGYALVAVTRNNAIFVRDQYFLLFDIPDNSPDKLRVDCSWVTHIFWGMDGEPVILGNQVIPWHGIRIERMVRKTPGILRGFPPSMPWWKRKALGLWKRVFRLGA